MADIRTIRAELAGEQRRELSLERAASSHDSRTIEVAFISEAPVERWWGVEIIDCATGSARLERLRNQAAVLVNHDPDQHVGVVETARMSSDRVGRAVLRFGRGELADQVLRDVRDGIRSKVSVGYRIHDLVLERTDGNISTYRVTDWEPYEISIVSVPADDTVGVGRALKKGRTMDQHQTRSQRRAGARANRELQLAAVPSDDRVEFQRHLDDLEAQGQEAEGNASSQYQVFREEAILALADMWPAYREVSALAATIRGDQSFTVAAFRERVLSMIKDRRAGPICTGKLEADHPAYGQGAREIVHTGPLQHFKGHDAVQRAYMVGQWFKSAAGDARAAAWCRDNGIVATRVMTESVFSNGGAVVPAMVAAEILSNVDQYGTYRRFARNWPLEVASLSVPTNNEGLTMGAVGENTATTASDLSLGAVTLIPKEFAGGVRISRALLEDSAPNLADFLTGELARALAKTEDLAGWVGDSSSTYAGMSGMFNRIKNDAACAGSKITAAAATHDTFAEIDVTDLVTLMGALPEYARIGAAWYCSGTARDLVFSRLTATAGGNNTQTLSAALSENYLGYPIRTSPVLPAGAATDYSGECMLAFGNLAMAAAFGDRRQLQVEFDLSRYIEYRQAYLQISSRFDIVNHLQGVSATVAGPLVALVGGAS